MSVKMCGKIEKLSDWKKNWCGSRYGPHDYDSGDKKTIRKKGKKTKRQKDKKTKRQKDKNTNKQKVQKQRQKDRGPEGPPCPPQELVIYIFHFRSCNSFIPRNLRVC